MSTQRSEAARLRALLPILEEIGIHNPRGIYNALVKKGVAPYTIKTMFIRLQSLYKHGMDFGLIDSDQNLFNKFMRFEMHRRFKTQNVYRPAEVKLTYEGFKALLYSTPFVNLDVRGTLLFLLKSGLRISELYKLQKSVNGNYFVQGKGGKFREVMGEPPEKIASRHAIVKALGELGMTPHAVRKLTATKIAESGVVPVHHLQAIMGWSNISTAQVYLQQASLTKTKEQLNSIL